jgi:hypothetical protein
LVCCNKSIFPEFVLESISLEMILLVESISLEIVLFALRIGVPTPRRGLSRCLPGPSSFRSSSSSNKARTSAVPPAVSSPFRCDTREMWGRHGAAEIATTPHQGGIFWLVVPGRLCSPVMRGVASPVTSPGLECFIFVLYSPAVSMASPAITVAILDLGPTSTPMSSPALGFLDLFVFRWVVPGALDIEPVQLFFLG